MRPSDRGSSVRIIRAICPPTLSALMVLTIPGLAHADPAAEPTSLASLVADVAEANQRLQDVGARVQLQQESVNKAIVEVQTAREAADLARQEVEASHQAVEDANAAIVAAQARFDTFAAASYVNGPSAALVVARTPEEIIATTAANQTLALSSEQVMAGLKRARTDVVNRDAAVRLAKRKADRAVLDAEGSQQAAVAALTAAQETFRAQQAEIDQLAAQRKTAQQKLDAAQDWELRAAPPAAGSTVPLAAADSAGPGGGDRWEPGQNPGAARVPYGDPSEWDLTLPAIPSAFLSGDPVQIINAVLQIAMNSMQVTQQLGKQFLQQMGILKPTSTGINNGAIPFVAGNAATEHVIRRAMSQLGVPYSWGGGNAAGPSRGIDSGAGTVGFDCSGLVLYAFAGVGIKLPHYSGSQYKMGRQIPASQMRRGDVIFYGPGGSQHVTIYLGNGQMIEAPYTGSVVKISPVRTSGMTPFVVRYIES